MTYDISVRHIGGMSQGRHIGGWCEGWTRYLTFSLTHAHTRGSVYFWWWIGLVATSGLPRRIYSGNERNQGEAVKSL